MCGFLCAALKSRCSRSTELNAGRTKEKDRGIDYNIEIFLSRALLLLLLLIVVLLLWSHTSLLERFSHVVRVLAVCVVSNLDVILNVAKGDAIQVFGSLVACSNVQRY